MQLRFLGAAQEVTGSMILLELRQGSILIDCGFFQGRRQESRTRNRELPKEAVAADVVVLTHAHVDHSGNLPTLVKRGCRAAIYTTAATRDLCAYMLRDSAHIQEADARYLNRKYESDPDFEKIEPLYDEEDVVRALSQFVCIPYGHEVELLPDVRARFLNAGHILGSASLVLEVREEGQTRRLVFSGDLGRRGLPIIRDPEYPKPPLDYVIMESTYGDREHGKVEDMEKELERIVHETVARGGKIIVPAFAVGRTQELLYVLNSLMRAKRLPTIPVFIDSPLAINVTEVFRLHPECFDAETRAFQRAHGEVFGFEGVHFVQSREESMRLNTLRGPAMIIAASGMAEAGRILHHLRNHIEDERNTLLIVGFAAQHTLARRIVERRPKVRIWGVERELRARVEVLDSFSAHADRRDLLAYAQACGTEVRSFFLVHGESEAQRSLADALKSRGAKVEIPARGACVRLD